MKKVSTLFLKLTVMAMALAAIGICGYVLPSVIGSDQTGYYRPILLGVYVTAIPFFYALVQTYKILNLIENEVTFSQNSVKALGQIKYCGAVMFVLYLVGMPWIYKAADQDDAPGVIIIGLVLTFGPLVVAVFAAVLEKLLQAAIEMKQENELTV